MVKHTHAPLNHSKRAQLLHMFEKSFSCEGLVKTWVDEHTHVINVKARVVKLRVNHQIPVPLGEVHGDFDCSNCDLTNLQNAPHLVTGTFNASNNLLTSLKGGPHSVGEQHIGVVYSCFRNRLENFEGAPLDFRGLFVGTLQAGQLKSVDGLPPLARLVDITWQPNLPLLKLINQRQVIISDPIMVHVTHETCDILNKYLGQNRPGALKAAAELIRAGYRENARW